ncbi:hypothetical protein ACFO25_02060 [Paenactinomyces guangxiensis]|uniref:Uncharacterized protein n=1 Tax=Paenactinomyces guangxiensis TaxID=1490290 RepID=A0A7W1WS97_9BACL|nr:hypothetical protein [Paenactinomyces guangxiensis]MBA4495014.1 hypothetical protein [Paenactinomyces guangxiensis]MBH8592097.1 hypothetical protein [Paenactinomyces guangxiensis]
MAKKKRSHREKKANRPPKPRFTSKANIYHSEVVAPLEKAYRQAMRTGNYEEAGHFFKETTEARKEHRLLLHRKELVKIN